MKWTDVNENLPEDWKKVLVMAEYIPGVCWSQSGVGDLAERYMNFICLMLLIGCPYQNRQRKNSVKSNKVTKKQLLSIIFCDERGRYKILIGNYWPWWRRKITVAEILEKAHKLGIGDTDIWWILHSLDHKNCPGLSRYNFTSRDVVDEYLALAKGVQKE